MKEEEGCCAEEGNRREAAGDTSVQDQRPTDLLEAAVRCAFLLKVKSNLMQVDSALF